MALAYKLLENGDGIAFDDSGRPIVIDDEKEENEEGREFGLDAIHLFGKIPQLNAEAKKYREERDQYKGKIDAFGDVEPEEVLSKLKDYDGIDPNEARKALETVANLDSTDQDRNIEIEKIKAQASEAWEKKLRDMENSNNRKLDDIQTKLQNKDNAIRELLIKGAFDSNEFIKEQTVVPSDMAYARFGSYFHVDDDDGKLKVIATHPVGGQKHQAGDPIYSQSRPGDLAEPEEAIEILINEYPNKENILRTNSGGSGSGGNTSRTDSERAKLNQLKGIENPSARLSALRNER